MLRSMLGGLLFVRELFFAERAPRQVAVAVALGMMLGLAMKGNLTSGVLLMLLFALRVNLGFGLLAACLFTAVAPLLDPMADLIGKAFLGNDTAKWVGGKLFALPLVPWTRLNNTVVLGQLLLGLGLAYPVYRLTLLFDAHLRRSVLANLDRLGLRRKKPESATEPGPTSGAR